MEAHLHAYRTTSVLTKSFQDKWKVWVMLMTASIAMSTSGSSVNVLNAIRKARSMNIPCLFLTSTACDLDDGDGLTIIRVQAIETARVQEVHGIIGHLLCSMIQSRLENFK